MAQLSKPSSAEEDRDGSSPDSAEAAAEAAEVPPVAPRFADFGAAAEAALRAIMTAVRRRVSPSDKPLDISTLCYLTLMCRLDNFNSVLVQHMGLCEAEALAQEQRQLYSLLNTLLKLGRCNVPGAELPTPDRSWTEGGFAGICCFTVGYAAVKRLLHQRASIAWLKDGQSQSGSAAVPPAPQAAVAAAQQSAVDYLPSLVILGRCCLLWAEQLQRAPELLQAVSTEFGPNIESLIADALVWVQDLESPAATTQLAAASCTLQQLEQQMDMLLSAQQETQQELTDASLTGLVRQLQATGGMLSSIAVPHFCNNPGCGNVSGPTEVQLVSGRSCVCAGCRTARYCGRACQRAAWQQHKPVCKALAAAAASAAAAGDGLPAGQ